MPAALAVVQWQSPQMLGVALLVGVLVVLAVVLLYPSQVRSLPTGWQVALPGLRCAAGAGGVAGAAGRAARAERG